MMSAGFTVYSTDKIEQYGPRPCRADVVADHIGTKRVDNNNKCKTTIINITFNIS